MVRAAFTREFDNKMMVDVSKLMTSPGEKKNFNSEKVKIPSLCNITEERFTK